MSDSLTSKQRSPAAFDWEIHSVCNRWMIASNCSTRCDNCSSDSWLDSNSHCKLATCHQNIALHTIRFSLAGLLIGCYRRAGCVCMEESMSDPCKKVLNSCRQSHCYYMTLLQTILALQQDRLDVIFQNIVTFTLHTIYKCKKIDSLLKYVVLFNYSKLSLLLVKKWHCFVIFINVTLIWFLTGNAADGFLQTGSCHPTNSTEE